MITSHGELMTILGFEPDVLDERLVSKIPIPWRRELFWSSSDMLDGDVVSCWLDG
jgi:hypothetical protein